MDRRTELRNELYNLTELLGKSREKLAGCLDKKGKLLVTKETYDDIAAEYHRLQSRIQANRDEAFSLL